MTLAESQANKRKLLPRLGLVDSVDSAGSAEPDEDAARRVPASEPDEDAAHHVPAFMHGALGDEPAQDAAGSDFRYDQVHCSAAPAASAARLGEGPDSSSPAPRRQHFEVQVPVRRRPAVEVPGSESEPESESESESESQSESEFAAEAARQEAAAEAAALDEQRRFLGPSGLRRLALAEQAWAEVRLARLLGHPDAVAMATWDKISSRPIVHEQTFQLLSHGRSLDDVIELEDDDDFGYLPDESIVNLTQQELDEQQAKALRKVEQESDPVAASRLTDIYREKFESMFYRSRGHGNPHEHAQIARVRALSQGLSASAVREAAETAYQNAREFMEQSERLAAEGDSGMQHGLAEDSGNRGRASVEL